MSPGRDQEGIYGGWVGGHQIKGPGAGCVLAIPGELG
jgi:hypothetical protein